MSRNTPEETVHKIISLLKGYDLVTTIEIIGNVLVRLSFESIGVLPENRVVTRENVFFLIMKDRELNGETLSNALGYQGLLMLDWVTKKKK